MIRELFIRHFGDWGKIGLIHVIVLFCYSWVGLEVGYGQSPQNVRIQVNLRHPSPPSNPWSLRVNGAGSATVSYVQGSSSGPVTFAIVGDDPDGTVSVSGEHCSSGIRYSPLTVSLEAPSFSSISTPITFSGGSANSSCIVTFTGTGGGISVDNDVTVTVNVTTPPPTPILVANKGSVTIDEGGTDSEDVRFYIMPGTGTPSRTVTIAASGETSNLTFSPTSPFTLTSSTSPGYSEDITIGGPTDSDNVDNTYTVTFTASGGATGSATVNVAVEEPDAPPDPSDPRNTANLTTNVIYPPVDNAQIIVSPDPPILNIPVGGTDEFTVNLKPDATLLGNFTVNLTETHDDISLLDPIFSTIPLPALTSLTYTTSDYRTPQEVRVQVAPDATSTSTSSPILVKLNVDGGGYHEALEKTVKINIIPAIITGAEIEVRPEELPLEPVDADGNPTSRELSVTLSHDPHSNVTISIEKEEDADNIIKETSWTPLTFTNSLHVPEADRKSHDTAQTITVTLNENLNPPEAGYKAKIKFSASNTGGYDDAPDVTVPVTVKWTPVANAKIQVKEKSISLKPRGYEDVEIDLRPRRPHADVTVNLTPNPYNAFRNVGGEQKEIITLDKYDFTFRKTGPERWNEKQIVRVTATEHAVSGDTPEIFLSVEGGGYGRATARIEVAILPPCVPAFADGTQALDFGFFYAPPSGSGSVILDPTNGSVTPTNLRVNPDPDRRSVLGKFQVQSTDCTSCNVTLKTVPTSLIRQTPDPSRVTISYEELLWAQSTTSDGSYTKIDDSDQGDTYSVIVPTGTSGTYSHWFQIGGKISGITQDKVWEDDGKLWPTTFNSDPGAARFPDTGLVVSLMCE